MRQGKVGRMGKDKSGQRDFSGKVALVTGGSRGIGREACRSFARGGARVAFLYRASVDEAGRTAAMVEEFGQKALAIQADVSDPSQVTAAVERVLEEFGRIDVLVHAAGAMGNWKTVREMEAEEWRRYIDVDLNGAFYVISSVLRPMQAQGGGVIVAISSIATQMCQARNAQGAAAKAGMEALIRVVAREEGRNGIRVNAVAVGLTETDMANVAFERWGPEVSKRIVSGIPLGRIGTPEEVAEFAAFLASDEGAYFTGKVLQIDGGQFIGG